MLKKHERTRSLLAALHRGESNYCGTKLLSVYYFISETKGLEKLLNSGKNR